jgi:hypothetical protein
LKRKMVRMAVQTPDHCCPAEHDREAAPRRPWCKTRKRRKHRSGFSWHHQDEDEMSVHGAIEPVADAKLPE